MDHPRLARASLRDLNDCVDDRLIVGLGDQVSFKIGASVRRPGASAGVGWSWLAFLELSHARYFNVGVTAARKIILLCRDRRGH
jgi:hypothetical protein